jgi:hypothetical protein
LKLISAANSGFKCDYHGEDEEGQQVPILTEFHKGAEGVIRLSWASELLFSPTEPCRHGRTDVDPFRSHTAEGGKTPMSSSNTNAAGARAERQENLRLFPERAVDNV